MKLSKVTQGLSGKLISDGDFRCLAFATEQTQAGVLTFMENEFFLPALQNSNISCVFTTEALTSRIPPHMDGIYVCQRPKATLFELHNDLSNHEEYVGTAFPTRIGEGCHISPLAVIDSENVIIGDGVKIEAFAVIKGRVTIGDSVTIRNGAVIGAKGFSFSKDEQDGNLSVLDTATIEIQDSVELFEHTVISTGIFPWEKTIIGKNTKIDAQCHIGHGAHIGENCLIAEGARCCGNSSIGANTWVGVGAVVSNRVQVGSSARVSIGAVVTKAVANGATVSGNFAIPHQRFLENLKSSAIQRQMPPPPEH